MGYCMQATVHERGGGVGFQQGKYCSGKKEWREREDGLSMSMGSRRCRTNRWKYYVSYSTIYCNKFDEAKFVTGRFQ